MTKAGESHGYIHSWCPPSEWQRSLDHLVSPCLAPCCQDIIVAGLSDILTIVVALFLVFGLCGKKTAEKYVYKPRDILLLNVKIFAWLLMAAVALNQYAVVAYENGPEGAILERVIVLLNLCSSVATLTLLLHERWCSGPILTWLARVVLWLQFGVQFSRFIEFIRKRPADTRLFSTTMLSFQTLYYGCWIVLGTLSLLHIPIPRLYPSPQYENPEERSSYLARILFSWMSPLMRRGAKVILQIEDVYPLAISDRCEPLAARFRREWRRSGPSLWKTFFRMYWVAFLWGGFLRFVSDVSVFVGPFALNLIVKFLDDPSQPAWRGYVYAGAMYAGQMLGSVSINQHFHVMMRLGVGSRSLLTAEIFRKTMLLNQESRSGISTGKIMNLMTSDCETMEYSAQYFHLLWSAPLRIALCLYLLQGQLGLATLGGIAVVLVALPIQKYLMDTQRNLTKRVLRTTDDRIKLVSEIFGSISIVKMYAWESSFSSRVEEVRHKELNSLRKLAVVQASTMFIITCVPILVSIAAFGMYTLLGNTLTPAVAFTSLSLFNILRWPLLELPQAIAYMVSSRVSGSRLSDLLVRNELILDDYEPAADRAVEIKNCDFYWAVAPLEPEDRKGSVTSKDMMKQPLLKQTSEMLAPEGDAAQDVVLHGVNLDIRRGELVVVIGETGSGKSSLLLAILGEMGVVRNHLFDADEHPVCRVTGKISYVAQQAWIFNATVRENITFGQPFDQNLYTKALEVSCLAKDLELFPRGDQTEIGEKGVNLSGGQKQRISLARAVYASADLVLLDDPLSALDAQVATTVFERLVIRHLKAAGATTVLVTNQMQFISQADRILLLKNHRIEAQGSYSMMLSGCAAFKELIQQTSQEAKGPLDQTEQAKVAEMRKRESSVRGEGVATLMTQEERETGTISWAVVRAFTDAINWPTGIALFFILSLLGEVVRDIASLWVNWWTTGELGNMTLTFFMATYVGWTVIQGIAVMIAQLVAAFAGIGGTKALHSQMMSTLLRAPVSFFQQTPLGRILNRFTKDIGESDKNLISNLTIFVSLLLALLGTIAVIAILSPVTMLPSIPTLYLFFRCQQYYQKTSRELKRLDSITRSPTYAHVQQCLMGLPTIRAYRAHVRLLHECMPKLDTSIKMAFAQYCSNRWLGINLNILGGILVFCTAFVTVYGRGNPTVAKHAGLLLFYSLQITQALSMATRFASFAENSFNSIERITHYCKVPSEAALIIPDSRGPPGWPDHGQVAFNNVQMRYREGLPLVLKDLSFNIAGGQKVGVVGRTGAGKSTLFAALFRLTELSGGSILLDGVNISTIGLEDLRNALCIIPQEPVLFTGSVRFNLDPFFGKTDAELWDALERVSLAPFVRQLNGQLEYIVQENGENISVGQRQLVCLARALLRRTRVIALDEATASVDPQTDALIQATIKSQFADFTVITIAHRLHTIIDSDVVLVMDQGRLAEFAPPHRLLMRNGIFSSMVAATGPETAKHLRAQAEEAFLAAQAREESLPSAMSSFAGFLPTSNPTSL